MSSTARRGMAAVAVAATLLVGGIPAAAGAATARTAASTTTITVIATEFKFKLSKTTVKPGTVIFEVKDAGKLAHDFQIDGHVTTLLNPGQTAKLKVTFKKAGSYHYICTIPGHAAAGMRGNLKVT
jgi:uncharacterized cupredoxin-like copper-binding protein